MLFSYNEVCWSKENVIKKIVSKRKYNYSTVLYLFKKIHI